METIGRYELLEELGRGGMATVYRAMDTSLNREVALKWLLPHLSQEPTFAARFQREARIVAQLEHAHIVPVYDVGVYGERPFLVMRLLRGGTLRSWLEQGRLHLPQLLTVMEQVAHALDTAHAHQIVHRDIKPTNILFDEQGAAFVSDFGIAKMMDSETQLTGSGIIGSPAYMSPEQFTGKGVDGRSDQYSLAVVIFEALTGQLPFSGDTAQVMYKHLQEPPPEIHQVKPEIPDSFSITLHRALSKQSSERFATVSNFVATLQTPANSLHESPKTQTSGYEQQLEKAYTQGMQAFEQQKWRDAVIAFDQVIRLNPNYQSVIKMRREAMRHLVPAPTIEAKSTPKHPPTDSRSTTPKTTTAHKVMPKAGGLENNEPVPSQHYQPWIVGGGVFLVIVFILLFIWQGLQPTAEEPAPTQPTAAIIEHTATEMTTVTTLQPTHPATALPTLVTGVIQLLSPSNQAEEIAFDGSPLQQQRTSDMLEVLQLQLPDGTQLFLGEQTTIQIVSIAGYAEQTVTEILLENGFLLAAANGQMVEISNELGAKAQTAQGLLGVVYTQSPFNFAASCLQGVCTIKGDLGGEAVLLAGQASSVGGNGQPGESTVALYEQFVLLSDLVPTPTRPPAATRTPIATATATTRPTNTRLPVTPTATASSTVTPVLDRDGDGFADNDDWCPDQPGSDGGCPPPTQPPSSYPVPTNPPIPTDPPYP